MFHRLKGKYNGSQNMTQQILIVIRQTKSHCSQKPNINIQWKQINQKFKILKVNLKTLVGVLRQKKKKTTQRYV